MHGHNHAGAALSVLCWCWQRCFCWTLCSPTRSDLGRCWGRRGRRSACGRAVVTATRASTGYLRFWSAGPRSLIALWPGSPCLPLRNCKIQENQDLIFLPPLYPTSTACIKGAEHKMAMAAPPAATTTPGSSTRKRCDHLPTVSPHYGTIKTSILADWSNTWVVYDMPELDVISCLQAMRDIQSKSKCYNAFPSKCEYVLCSRAHSSSSTAHRLHIKPGISRARNLFYQRKQKTFLLAILK